MRLFGIPSKFDIAQIIKQDQNFSVSFRYLPAMKCPGLEEFIPDCYYGYVEGTDQVVRAKGILDFLWKMRGRKKEQGIIMLQDMSRGPEPFGHIDKTKIVTPEAYSEVLKFLGHYHGVWWQVLNGKSKYYSDTCSSNTRL